MRMGFAVPDFPKYVLILGSLWRIEVRKYHKDPYFEKYDADGYCSSPERLIALCDPSTYPSYKDECVEYLTNVIKQTLRHEIVHAYLYESGLGENSNGSRIPWARNEEIIDWFARQGQKIHKTWEECHCLYVVNVNTWTDWVIWSKEQVDKNKVTFDHALSDLKGE